MPTPGLEDRNQQCDIIIITILIVALKNVLIGLDILGAIIWSLNSICKVGLISSVLHMRKLALREVTAKDMELSSV